MSSGCDFLLLDFAALGAGSLSPTPKKCRHIYAHLRGCEACKVYLATFLLAWGKEHKLPPAPRMLERWSPVAVHLCYAGSDVQGAVLRPGESWWSAWKRRLTQLEQVARTACVDHEEGPFTQWLTELAHVAKAVGGFLEDPTDVDVN